MIYINVRITELAGIEDHEVAGCAALPGLGWRRAAAGSFAIGRGTPMSVYDKKPWLGRYDRGQPAEISPGFTDALSMFRASVERNPDGDIIRYFGGRITAGELDVLTDAMAAGLLDLGLTPGDRVALYLQNVPQFVIGLIATWKAGGIAVPVNPMNRERELEVVLRDSGARVLVCLQSLYRDAAAAVVGGTDVS